ncbi:MAG: gamma-glutamyl-gamma-aminobutyrate hydrolase family protein, partial [Nitrospirota bacterium]|nr:gamma-glutamyl-gamma-aminobutyrate hydrolase family protein [Nitrospirota bacterium]
MSSPIIGITVDIKDKHLGLKRHYADAIARTGGIPLLIPPTGKPLSYAEIINGLLIPGGNDLDPFYYGEEMT